MPSAVKTRALFRGVAPLGQTVFRTGNATEWAADATVDLFLITGGDILLQGIYGIVTTQLAGNAALWALQFNPTSAGGAVALSGASATVAGDVVDTMYTMTGTPGDALTINQAPNDMGLAVYQLTNTVILVPGMIQLFNSAALTSAPGVIDWCMQYAKLSSKARVIVQ